MPGTGRFRLRIKVSLLVFELREKFILCMFFGYPKSYLTSINDTILKFVEKFVRCETELGNELVRVVRIHI